MKKNILSLLLLVNLAYGDYIRDNVNNIILDTSTNLMWQDDGDANTLTKNWNDAISYCEAKSLGGYNDWKLPNLNELYNIANRSIFNPAIDSTFQSIVNSYYWSSTTVASDTSYAWGVYFDRSNDIRLDTTNTHYVRCVRIADDTTNPIFTSSNTADATENRTDAITLIATDDSGRDTITYSISGGADSASFNINGSTGVVTFITAPDFETKDTYTFTAKATDGFSNETTQNVTITILNEDIAHNTTNYESIVSPHTGEIWLDRNLGASQVCTAFDDTNCYGDYYQWGRDADGHEDSGSTTTATRADSITPSHANFITNDADPYDWVQNTTQDSNNIDDDGALRSANWSAIDGSSICPTGYRVATEVELAAETTDVGVGNRADAYSSFLKLPSAGYRTSESGSTNAKSTWGNVWSISTSESKGRRLFFGIDTLDWHSTKRANGLSVRCVKD